MDNSFVRPCSALITRLDLTRWFGAARESACRDGAIETLPPGWQQTQPPWFLAMDRSKDRPL